MKIAALDRSWQCDRAVAIARDYVAKGPSAPLFLLGCERCKAVCSLAPGASCRCCSVYKTRTAGGSMIYWPEDNMHHVQLMPMIEFLARMREEVA